MSQTSKYVINAVRTGDLGVAGTSNLYGEEQLALDVLSDRIMRKRLTHSGVVCNIASEEMDEIYQCQADADGLLQVTAREQSTGVEQSVQVKPSHGLTDEAIDACIDRADAILVEAVGLPVLTTASAMAVISLFIDDVWMLSQHSVYGDAFLALAKAVRDYIGEKVQS